MDDSIEEVTDTSLQDLGRAAEDRTLRTSLIHRIPGSGSQLNGM